MSTLFARTRNSRRAIAAGVLVAVPIALSVAGCRATDGATPSSTTATATTFTDRPADEIRDAAAINFVLASSVHVRGYVTTTSGKEEFDLVLSGHDGHLVMTDEAGPLEMIRVGDVLYIKGTREYWRPSGEAAVKLMDGKYLKTPTSEQHFASFNSYFDMTRFLPTQHLTKGSIEEINATTTIALIDPDPQRGGTLYVTTQRPPRPARIQSTAGILRLDFTDYNLPVDITAPPSTQTVDIDELLRVVNG